MTAVLPDVDTSTLEDHDFQPPCEMVTWRTSQDRVKTPPLPCHRPAVWWRKVTCSCGTIRVRYACDPHRDANTCYSCGEQVRTLDGGRL